MAKPRMVQVTDSEKVEAVTLGMAGDLKAPVGGFIRVNGAKVWYADADSLRDWRASKPSDGEGEQ